MIGTFIMGAVLGRQNRGPRFRRRIQERRNVIKIVKGQEIFTIGHHSVICTVIMLILSFKNKR